MSGARIGENNPSAARAAPSKAKKLMSEFAKNREFDPKPGKTIYSTSLDNIIVQEFESIREAGRVLKASLSTIYKYLDQPTEDQGSAFIF
jgi:hypothetical protein